MLDVVKFGHVRWSLVGLDSEAYLCGLNTEMWITVR